MAEIGGFVQQVLGVGAVVSSLLVIAAFLGRSQIAHWLNKDIERIKSQYQAELESQKASHMQALEAYKVSLIAEAERAKAAQAVKTAVAIKFAEHQFTAASKLVESVVGLAATALIVHEGALNFLTSGDQSLLADMHEKRLTLNKSFMAYHDAIFANKFYFEDEDIEHLNKYSLLISGIIATIGDLILEAMGATSLRDKPRGVDEFLACADSEQRISFVNSREAEIVMVLKKYTLKYLSV